MRDIMDVLKEMNNAPDSMELCEDFHKIQSILNHTNQLVRSFDKIVFQGGNEPYIIEIVARLLRYLRVQNYLTAENKVNEQHLVPLRKIALYMMLNTDVSFRYDLSRDTRITQVLDTVPQLSKCLLMNCVWGLDLNQFFYEMLKFSPLWFSMQYLDQAIVSLKYGKPYDTLERVESMLCAIYYAICREDHDCKKLDRNRYVDQQRTLNRMLDFAMDLIRQFTHPVTEKFSGWTGRRMQCYFGFLLKHTLATILYCLEMYQGNVQFVASPVTDMYAIMKETGAKRERHDQYSQATETVLIKINNSLLNALDVYAGDLTVEAFMSWIEIDMPPQAGEKMTLQRINGELAYRLCECLRHFKEFKRHTVCQKLRTFAMKPKTIAQKAREMTVGVLLKELDSVPDPGEREVLYSELLSRAELVLGNNECLDVVEEYLPLISRSNVMSMIKYDIQFSANEDIDEQDEPDELLRLRQLIVMAVGYLPDNETILLVQQLIDDYGLSFKRYEKPRYGDRVEKYIDEMGRDEEPNPFQLIFQSPAAFYAKIAKAIESAETLDERQLSAIVNILHTTKRVACLYLIKPLQELIETCTKERLIDKLQSLLVRLYKAGVFGQELFVRSFLIHGLKRLIDDGKRSMVLMLLKVTEELFASALTAQLQKEPFTGSRAVLLAKELCKDLVIVVADIVNRMRFEMTDLKPYEPINEIELVEQSLTVVTGLLDTLQKRLEKEELEQFLAKTEHLSPITQYYFHASLKSGEQNATHPLGTPVPEFASYLYGDLLANGHDTFRIKQFLQTHFYRCSTGEAERLARDPLLAPYISESLLSSIDTVTQQQHYLTCLQSMVQNYLHIVDRVLLPAAMATNALPADRHSLARSLRQLPEKLPKRQRQDLLQKFANTMRDIVRKLHEQDDTLELADLLESLVVMSGNGR